MQAGYDAIVLALETAIDMEGAAPARVHGVECVEIQVKEWRRDGTLTPASVFYAREETGAESRWLAVVDWEDGVRNGVTFRDEDFASQWGASSAPFRELFGDGRYELLADGSYQITSGRGLGAGTYEVSPL